MNFENMEYNKFKRKFGQFILAIALILWGGYIYLSDGHQDKVTGILFVVVGIGYLTVGIVLNVRKEK